MCVIPDSSRCHSATKKSTIQVHQGNISIGGNLLRLLVSFNDYKLHGTFQLCYRRNIQATYHYKCSAGPSCLYVDNERFAKSLFSDVASLAFSSGQRKKSLLKRTNGQRDYYYLNFTLDFTLVTMPY